MNSINVIGPLIQQGLSSRQIRKQYPWFPSQPDINFFIDIGYKESTAQSYYRMLLKTDEDEKTELKNKGVIISDGAHLDNLLVDTSALSLDICLNLIRDANKVTFIYSTLAEMDKLKNKSRSLSSNIQNTTLSILANSNFFLSQFSGNNNETYVDNILIQYLNIIPKDFRPTLITADFNLTVKAKLYELEFILAKCVNDKIECSLQDSTNSLSYSKCFTRKLGCGASIIDENEKKFLVYNGTYKIQIHHGKKTLQFHGPKMEVFPGDIIDLQVNYNGNIQSNRFIV